MKYLLNLPLAIGAVAQVLFAAFALMSGPWANWEDGPSRGAMAFIMFEPAALSWVLLLGVGIAAVFTDAFEWSPVVHRGRRRAAILAATLLVVVTLGVCMAVALGSSPAVGSNENDGFNGTLVAIARFGGIGGPLLAMGWLAWLIDAPPARRHLAWLRRTVIAVFALTTIAGGILGAQMLSEEIAVERGVAARDQQMIDERDRDARAGLAALSDASPLADWLHYIDRLETDGIRNEAVWRLTARPTLEADLADTLRSSDADTVDGAVRLIGLVDFKPSAALAAPLRDALGYLVRRIRNDVAQHPDDDEYVGRWFSDQWSEALVAVKKLAASGGVDLRDALRAVVQATTESSPKSPAAKSFARDLAAADRPIDTALAAHRPN